MVKLFIIILTISFTSLFSQFRDVYDKLQTSISFTKIYTDNKPFHIPIIKEGLPRNTRHITEGYWIGSFPNEDNIKSLHSHNIKLIITVTYVNSSFDRVKSLINNLSINHLYIPIGSKFPKISQSQLATISSYYPNEIFVHCDHGADRSGIFIAYLLIKFHNYSVPRALLSVINKNDVSALKKILSDHYYIITDDDLLYTSIYSGNGGLKIRGESYIRLVTTFLHSL